MGVSTSKTYLFYFGKIFKKLNLWVFTKYFNIAKYIDYLEKNSIRSLVWLKLFWSSNSRLFWFKVLVNVLNSVTIPVIFILTLMLRSTEISIFTIQTPGNEILMPNTEKSLDLYCWCSPGKIYENKVTMNLIFFFKFIYQISLKAFLNSITLVRTFIHFLTCSCKNKVRNTTSHRQ